MTIEAIIYDCDGVMFDSKQANINFYNHILTHFGLPPLRPEHIEFVHMHTAEESVNYIFGNSPQVKAAQEYRLHLDYTPFIKDMVMEPGLKEMLRILRPRYGLAVATNRSTTIGTVLELNQIGHYFDIVVSSLDVKSPKPDPESVFRILDFFRIKPEQCYYVGDSEVDRAACTASGVAFVAYRNRDLKADYHIDAHRDILKIV